MNTVIPSAPTVSLNEGSTATFTVRLANPPTSTVTLTVSSSDAGAATASPATLSFSAMDYATPKVVTVTGVQDADVAAEMVTLTVAGGGLTPRTIAVNVNDDDVLSLIATPTSLQIVEGSTTPFNVMLGAQPAGPVTVNISSANPAVATVATSSLVFTPTNYNTAQAVVVTAVADTETPPINNTTTITLAAPGVMASPVAVTSVDDDLISAGVSPTQVCPGDSGTLRVRLLAAPTSNKTITITTVGSVQPSPTSLTFTTANWSTEQFVDVVGLSSGSAQVRLAGPGLSTVSVGMTVLGPTVPTCNL